MNQRFTIRILKLIFVVSTLSFLVIQIQLRRHQNQVLAPADNAPSPPAAPGPRTFPEPPSPKLPHSAAAVVGGADAGRQRTAPNLTIVPRDFGGEELKVPKPSLEDIRHSIEFNNANAEVYNEDKFGPVAEAETVIVVQVHNRSKYLDMLVQSLKQAQGIEKIVLIFSHDFYSLEINKIVRSIDFCRVMQIFYPYSIQIFPDKFPGQDPKDCPSDVNKETAQGMNCQNWEHPDKYGHYRVAKFTQIKHHWWWKMNYVFDGIPKLRSYNGWVLQLEEDHFVSPDFLHVLRYIVKDKQRLCKECSIIALGVYLKSYGLYGSNVDKLAVYPWFSSRHNLGMAFNRDTWIRVRNCSQLFCSYDDYNWDWSLMRINIVCMKPERMTVLYPKAPRVFHIGDCGVHHKCRADTSAQKVITMLEGVKNKLFPDKLDVSERSKRMLRPPKENGGWGDVRDHQLCLNNTRWGISPEKNIDRKAL